MRASALIFVFFGHCDAVGDDAHIVPAFLFEEGGPPKVVEGVIQT